MRAVLSPGAKVVATGDALPARPPDGEVGLPGEVQLRRRPFPLPRFASCTLPRCSPKHLFEYPIDLQTAKQRTTSRKKRRRQGETWEEAVYLVYSWKPSSVRTRGSDRPERITLSGSPRSSHLLAKEDDYTIDYATEAAIHELISAGNLEGLWDLMLWMKIGDSTELHIVLVLFID
jgi:hypothetical protein